MSKWARMDGNRVVETFDHPENPAALFDPSWTWIACPAETVQGSTKSGSNWTHPAPAAPVDAPAPVKRKLVSRTEYYGLFTALEEAMIRIAAGEEVTQAKLAAANATEAERLMGVAALQVMLRRTDALAPTDTLDLASAQVQQGLGLLAQMGLLTAERKVEIEQGL